MWLYRNNLHGLFIFSSTKVKPFYLYKAVNSKLHNAFDLSKYSKMDISRDYKTAITFHTKSDKFDPSLVSSSIGRLCGLRSSSQRPDAIQSDGEEMEHDQFLKMKPVSKDWESSTLEMKKKVCGMLWLVYVLLEGVGSVAACSDDL